MTSRFPNFDLKLFLKDHKLRWREWESGDHTELALNCPSCVERGEARADTKQRLWVNEGKSRFYCYNCSWSGDIARLVMKISGASLERAFRIMTGKAGSLEIFNFPLAQPNYDADDDEESDDLREVPFPHGFESFEDRWDEATVFHRYLQKRGIDLDYAVEMGWGFSRIGYVANRVVVPTYMNDRLVFWQARDVLNQEHPDWGTRAYRKVLNPSGVSKQRVLYNYDNAKTYSEIILCEGFVDALKAGKNAVAINGKKLHAAQVEALAKTKARTIILLLDPDAYTDQRNDNTGKVIKLSSAEQARKLLAIYFNVKTVRLPVGRDAGSYSRDELAAIVRAKTM